MLYNRTVKFSSHCEHTEQDILKMLSEAGYIKKVWGINLSNRGKYVEVKCNHQMDCNNLIQKGIYDSQYATTYTVEPAFEANKTQITVFNVPLAASGTVIQQYLKENHLEILAFERQIARFEGETVYTGVIKYKCIKREGFINLPPYKTFYNNRRIGIRHPEQYEERNKVEAERVEKEKENEERERIATELERENAGRKRIQEDEKRRKEKIRQNVEADGVAARQKEKQNIGIVKQLMQPGVDAATVQALYFQHREINKMDEAPTRPADGLRRGDIDKDDEVDMDIHIETTDTSGPPTEVTDQSGHLIESHEEKISVPPQAEKHPVGEGQTVCQEESVETMLLKEIRIEKTPKMREIEVEQKGIEEEIKIKDVELQVQKEIATNKTTSMVEKEEALGKYLEERADEYRKEKEDNTKSEEPEAGKDLETQLSHINTEVEIKETRILQKPIRSESIMTSPTEFVPPNVPEMIFAEPEEGEILTPGLCTSFFKRKINQAGISTDEEVKTEEKRRTPKMKDESDVQLFRMGDFRKGIKYEKLELLKKRIENEKLIPEEKDEIMVYLMDKKGDLSGMGTKNIKPEERIDFIAYTCFMTAGSLHQLKPRDGKNMWDPPIQHAWQILSDKYKTKDHPTLTKRYKTIINRINKH